MIEKLLAKNGISLDTIFLPYDASCIGIKGFEKYCYQRVMLEHIQKKYRLNYIDSLCNAVSYTHLDVYKRQDFIFIFIIERNGIA